VVVAPVAVYPPLFIAPFLMNVSNIYPKSNAFKITFWVKLMHILPENAVA
jgi:hypothetical protein